MNIWPQNPKSVRYQWSLSSDNLEMTDWSMLIWCIPPFLRQFFGLDSPFQFLTWDWTSGSFSTRVPTGSTGSLTCETSRRSLLPWSWRRWDDGTMARRREDETLLHQRGRGRTQWDLIIFNSFNNKCLEKWSNTDQNRFTIYPSSRKKERNSKTLRFRSESRKVSLFIWAPILNRVF